MKKKLAAVTLFLSSALVATGCDSNEVTYKENDKGQSIIFSINGSDYTADDLLKDLQDSSSAKSKLYSEVSRQVFTKYAEDNLGDNKLESIREDADSDVADFKDDCQSKAKEEGTDYDTYLENALSQKGVETLEELKALYYYQGLKSEILDDFVEEENNYNYFLDKYLSAYTPFQVKHVLVAANTADTKYVDGTMTADNARKLLSILDRFVAGDSFDKVAELTDDTSSKDNGGVMPFNEAQNYVSEFRFATYAQEIFGKNQTLDARYDAAVKLHIINEKDNITDEERLEAKQEFEDSNLYSVYANGIESVQLSDIYQLKDEVTNDMKGNYNYFNEDDGSKKGNEVPTIAEQPYEMNVSKFNDDGIINPKYFEEYQLKRNEIFNRYLNTHEVKYIELSENQIINDPETGKPLNYAQVDGKYYLADNNGNLIFFAIASTGIHFMANVWNSNDPLSVGMSDEAKESLAELALEKNGIKTEEGKSALQLAQEKFENNFNRKINEAYFTLYDDDENDVDYSKYQYTYIGRNGAYNTESKLVKNSDSLLSAISGYASSLEYYLFDAIVYQATSELVSDAKYSISFFDEELNDIIKEFVQDKLTSTDESFASSVESAAETYGSKLARAAEIQSAIDSWYK